MPVNRGAVSSQHQERTWSIAMVMFNSRYNLTSPEVAWIATWPHLGSSIPQCISDCRYKTERYPPVIVAAERPGSSARVALVL
jgi:hypothetical protein